MLHTLFLTALLGASHLSPLLLNGTWQGHINAQNTADGCSLDQCNMDRNAVFVFRNGHLMWGEDEQTLEQADNDWFDMHSHGEARKPGYTVSIYYMYSFRPTSEGMQYVLTHAYDVITLEGTKRRGCVCVYTGMLAQQK